MSEYWDIIWEDFKSGSISSFELIYREYIDLLYIYGSKITDNEDILKDSVQQLFLELYTSGKNLSNPQNIKFYLLKALKIIIINEIKKSRKLTTLESIDFIQFDIELDAENKLIDSEVKQDRVMHLQELLNELSPEKRELLFLKFYSGLNNHEIGKVLGLKQETVKKKIYRTLKQLRINFQRVTFVMFGFCHRI